MLTRRLAACGLGVHISRRRDRDELVIVNLAAARSCLTLTGSGQARWHYEPPADTASAGTLTAIITHILGAPHAAGSSPGTDAYRAFPVKGAVGRTLADRGLTVALRISEDWDSFEATTSIDVTSPARPWLGTVQLTDDGHLDWDCDWRAAFDGDPAQVADIIAPILRAHLGSHLPAIWHPAR